MVVRDQQPCRHVPGAGPVEREEAALLQLHREVFVVLVAEAVGRVERVVVLGRQEQPVGAGHVLRDPLGDARKALRDRVLHDQAGARRAHQAGVEEAGVQGVVERGLVVAPVGAVRGAHLAQDRARPLLVLRLRQRLRLLGVAGRTDGAVGFSGVTAACFAIWLAVVPSSAHVSAGDEHWAPTSRVSPKFSHLGRLGTW